MMISEWILRARARAPVGVCVGRFSIHDIEGGSLRTEYNYQVGHDQQLIPYSRNSMQIFS